MTSTVQQSKNAVTLKGSAAIISEFFNYGVNSILYQRGIYPPESFTRYIIEKGDVKQAERFIRSVTYTVG